MGDGNKTKQTEQQSNTPWAGQLPFLTGAFNEAQTIYNGQKNQPGYQGDYYAAPTQDMVSAFQNALKGSSTNTLATQASDLGGQNAALGAETTKGALNGLTAATQADTTQSQMDAATKFANGAGVDGVIDGAMRDARRQFSEVDRPNLERDAAATGNTNSSRTGVADGILQRGLADKTADVSAQVRNDAYNTGLKLAQGNEAQKAGILSQIAGFGSDLSKQGLAGFGLSSDINTSNLNNSKTASGMLQGFNQMGVDNDLAKYTASQNLPWERLGRFFNIVGGQSWGSEKSGTTTKTETPSLMSSIGQGVGILGSLFKG